MDRTATIHTLVHTPGFRPQPVSHGKTRAESGSVLRDRRVKLLAIGGSLPKPRCQRAYIINIPLLRFFLLESDWSRSAGETSSRDAPR